LKAVTCKLVDYTRNNVDATINRQLRIENNKQKVKNKTEVSLVELFLTLHIGTKGNTV